MGSASIYALLNLMSESGIDAYRTASVLGYCLLPLVLLSVVSIALSLEFVPFSCRAPYHFELTRLNQNSGTLGYVLSALTIAWCSYSASSIFSSVLRLSSQKFLVAYPVGLLCSFDFFYVFFLKSRTDSTSLASDSSFALLSVFDAKTGGVGVKG